MKKISKDIVLIAIFGMMIIAALVLAYLSTKVERKGISDQVEKEKYIKEELAKNKVNFFTLRKIQTNITSPTLRMMQVELTVVLEPIKKSDLVFLESEQAFLHDLVINLVAQNSSEDLNSISGKIILSEKIKNGIHEKFNREIVKRVLFSSFSVQIQ